MVFVVVKNVKPHTVVGGVSTKELNTTSHPEYIHHLDKEEWLK
jgi:hypothetical protein